MSISTRSTTGSQSQPARDPASPQESAPAARTKWRIFLPLPTGKPLGVLLLAILTLLAAVALLELPVLHHTKGNILFPLDNAYVNITVGRDLAFYQVWGVSKYAFQSAASSLLYPIALAPIFFILGAHLIIPLVVNLLAAAYFLLVFQRALIRYGFPPARQFLVLIAAMGLTLLPLLVVSGMEYTLQLLFVFLFMDVLVQTLSTPNTPAAAPTRPATAAGSAQTPTAKAPGSAQTPAAAPATLYIFAVLAVAARYEDLLVIALGVVLFGLQKGWRPAAKLAAIAVAPIILFGVISVIKKSYFLPNTMLVGPYPTYAAILALIATAAAAWLIIRYSTIAPKRQPIPPGHPAAKPQPTQASQASQPQPAQARRVMPPPTIPALAILVLLAVPFTARNAANLAHFEKDCDRIYDEQYLTANFVHLYYFKQTVGTNQPGAISYFSEGRKLDYTGIASNDVVRMTKEYGWTPLYADSLSKKDGIRVAIVADPWFRADQLPKWTKVATWDIAEGAPSATNQSAPNQPAAAIPPTAGERAVNFYAVEAYDTTWLRKRLHEYQHLLPSTVAVKYY